MTLGRGLSPQRRRISPHRGLSAAVAALGALALALVVAPSDANAQPFANPTDAQVKLYEQATAAYSEGKYPKAIELLRSSLALGELNIVYLNLGRALFRDGQCDAADEAYAKALTAPAVEAPSPDAVKAKVEQFRGEFSQCPALVTVQCSPPDLRISIDGKPPVACGMHKLSPGEHLISTIGAKNAVQMPVQAVARKRMTVTVDASDKTDAPTPTSPFLTWGAVTASVGAVSLLGGVIVDQAVLGGTLDEFREAVAEGDPEASNLRSDAEGQQTMVLTLYSVGGALIVGGGALMVVGLLDEPEADPEGGTSAVIPWIAPDRAGASWAWTW